MNAVGEFLIGLVIFIGLLGIVLPVLPGLLLIIGAVGVWALEQQTTLGWIVFVVSIAIAAGVTVAKYLLPGRRLRESGVPLSTMLLASVAAVVGFFVIPVIGAPLGFVAAIYLIQRSRRGPAEAWPATKRTAGAIALSIGIELGGGLLIAGVWLLAAVTG
jgi:uncharacterized protein